MTIRFDAIVIGTGQAGPPLAGRLSQAGMKVAVIERGRFGGTCVNTGCIPTKTLIASAYVAHTARRAGDYGIGIAGEVAVDMKAVQARKDEISGRSRQNLERWLRGLQNVSIFAGTARFEDAKTLRVGDETLSAEKIFINVGGRAFVPPLPGIEQTPFLTNSGMMEVDFVPEHLVVVGGSYVGLEFAQMYRRFGSQVTVVEKDSRLISREDEDISDAIRKILELEGIHTRRHATCTRTSRTPTGVRIAVDCRDGEPEIAGSHLLLAVGRRPNTNDLGLDRAGIAANDRGYIKVDDQCRSNVPGIWALGDCNGRGAFTHTAYNDFEIVAANLLDNAQICYIKVDDQCRSNVPGIWALGDCNGRGAFTHTAYNDFEIVAANLLDNDPGRISDRLPCYALFTDPPLGRAGTTEARVKRAGRKALIGKRPMSRVSRAVERGESQGFMKVVVAED